MSAMMEFVLVFSCMTMAFIWVLGWVVIILAMPRTGIETRMPSGQFMGDARGEVVPDYFLAFALGWTWPVAVPLYVAWRIVRRIKK